MTVVEYFCCLSVFLQNQYPNACHDAEGGYWGSKFVTVIATGGNESSEGNDVTFFAYQVLGGHLFVFWEVRFVPDIGAG